MRRVLLLAVAALMVFVGFFASQTNAQYVETLEPAFTLSPVRVGVAPRIEELAKRVPAPKAYGEQREVYNESIPEFLIGRGEVETKADPLQRKLITSNAPSAGLSFDGYSNQDNANVIGGLIAPPDVNGDVGTDYYVQYVNLGWIFFNKSDGSVAGGPFAGNSFWQGFGGVCETQNAGDPIVLYDHLADRWVFSQFTNPSNPDGHQCFAITQGSDPAGPYFLYDFIVSPGEFNDYPKIGIWTDGAGQSSYVMMTNNFTASFSGVQVTSFERDAMLAGTAAQGVAFKLNPSATPTAFGIQPAHLEGPAAPAGTCPLYVQAIDKQTWGGTGSDGYQFWELCNDWNNVNNAAFTATTFVNTTAFDAELCGFSRDCIPQPGTTQRLDTLGQFTMYRFQNRFINGDHLAVINHTVDSGANVAGIRWAQFDITNSSSISIADTGTLAPGDGISRWLGSVAMDGDGNIGLSYTRANGSNFPSVYFTGRETTDPAGTLQAESVCVDGTGSQLGTNRWVDYSSISVDPVDNCTFWLTNEYVETTGNFSWNTRICSFSFASCGNGGGGGGGGGGNPVTVTLTSIASEDGWTRESSENSNVGNRSNSTGTGAAALRVGDNRADRQWRSVVSFDTSAIPAGATIQSATLRLQRGRVTGLNPFTNGFGACTVDIRNGGFSGNTALQNSDFEAAATVSGVGSLSNAPANGDWSEAAISAAGLAAINTSGTTQFRFAFTLDDNDNASNDFIGYFSGDNSNAARHPQLVVTYVP